MIIFTFAKVAGTILVLLYYYVLTSKTQEWLLIIVLIATVFFSYVATFIVYQMNHTGVAYISGLASFFIGYLIALIFFNFKWNSIIYILFMLLSSIPGFISGYYFYFASMIFGTSFMGAYMLVRGIAVYFEGFPNEWDISLALWELELLPINKIYYYFLPAFFVVPVIMAFF